MADMHHIGSAQPHLIQELSFQQHAINMADVLPTMFGPPTIGDALMEFIRQEEICNVR